MESGDHSKTNETFKSGMICYANTVSNRGTTKVPLAPIPLENLLQHLQHQCPLIYPHEVHVGFHS